MTIIKTMRINATTLTMMIVIERDMLPGVVGIGEDVSVSVAVAGATNATEISVNNIAQKYFSLMLLFTLADEEVPVVVTANSAGTTPVCDLHVFLLLLLLLLLVLLFNRPIFQRPFGIASARFFSRPDAIPITQPTVSKS